MIVDINDTRNDPLIFKIQINWSLSRTDTDNFTLVNFNHAVNDAVLRDDAAGAQNGAHA